MYATFAREVWLIAKNPKTEFKLAMINQIDSSETAKITSTTKGIKRINFHKPILIPDDFFTTK